MDAKLVSLLVVLGTVCVNLALYFTGASSSLNCTVGRVGESLTATAHAAWFATGTEYESN